MDMTMHTHRPDPWDMRNEFIRNNSVRRFHQEGFTEIAIDPRFLLQRINAIKDGMRRMTENEAHRDAFSSYVPFTDEMGWDHDSGLVRRDEDEQKWFFHVYPDTRKGFADRKAPVNEYVAFFKALEEVTARSHQIAIQFADLWDQSHNLPFSIKERFEQGCAVTRVLRYLHRTKGSPDATIHFDRSGITCHWLSTKPGLHIFTPQGTKSQVAETNHDRLTIFPGKKWAGITAGTFGPGTPHGVIDPERDQIETEDRYALVTFVHCSLKPEEARWVHRHKNAFDAIEASCEF